MWKVSLLMLTATLFAGLTAVQCLPMEGNAHVPSWDKYLALLMQGSTLETGVSGNKCYVSYKGTNRVFQQGQQIIDPQNECKQLICTGSGVAREDIVCQKIESCGNGEPPVMLPGKCCQQCGCKPGESYCNGICIIDSDGDCITDCWDNCKDVKNPECADHDSDGVGDVCDNCMYAPNPKQENADKDATGDVCDEDDDNDGKVDISDNCPKVYNPDQKDNDKDGWGDACDKSVEDAVSQKDKCNPRESYCNGRCILDSDEDCIADHWDNCIYVKNRDQADQDNDKLGDVCDNCHDIYNPKQENMDNDAKGDVCDEDVENDGFDNTTDNCPKIFNPHQADYDGDNVGDVCDNCRNNTNVNQEDIDNDGIGNACDNDNDNDGHLDVNDNCPQISNPHQADQDNDGVGDVCDNCPSGFNPKQKNTDNDAKGNACDRDKDNDGHYEIIDNCPLMYNPNQTDQDGDKVGDVCDNCPSINNANQEDLDSNGIGDACDEVRCQWKMWSAWKPCSLTCGGGQQPRNRVEIPAQNGGAPCVGPSIESRECNSRACPVDCQWLKWSRWSTCSLTCGRGQQTRSRGKIPPQYGGAPCVAPSSEARDCNTHPCPVCEPGETYCSGSCIIDSDGDCITDRRDNCKYVKNKNQADQDNDSVGDVCDNCVYAPNRNQKNTDSDTIGDACDEDDDNDGRVDTNDNCPTIPNPDQSDRDGDGWGDVCDKSMEDVMSQGKDMSPEEKNLAVQIMEKLLDKYYSNK